MPPEHSENDDQQKKQPPKIKLGNGNGNGKKKETGPVEEPPSKSGEEKEAPPKIKLHSSEDPSESVSFKQPSKGKPSDPKSDTTRIDISKAQAGDAETEEKAQKEPEAEQKPSETGEVAKGIPSQAKEDTSKIDLRETAKTQQPAEDQDEPEEARDSTDEIEDMGPSRQSTMRIQLDEDDVAGKTAQADQSGQESAEAEPAEETTSSEQKGETARIDLGELLSEEEEKPQRKPGSGPPKTVRLKRPGQTAPTVAMKRPDEEAESEESDSSSKGETARIDMPEEEEAAPSTQRKTIRIKRPDGGAPTAPRTMPVARPAEKKAAEEPEAAAVGAPGLFFTILSGFAVVITAVLVYVLAAQLQSIGQDEDTPSWPYSGRIIQE